MDKTLKTYFREYGGRPRKSLGQVFLIERAVQAKILEMADPGPGDTVVEIGPGTGALTRELLPRVKRLIALEIDPGLARYLRSSLSSAANLHLICMDALRFDYRRAALGLGVRLKVVGNIPYGISSPLLFSFLDQREAFSMLLLMLQKEVAQRLTAPPSTRRYGILSVLCSRFFDLTLERHVSRHCFHPVPKVDSAVIRMVPKTSEPVTPAEEAVFRQVVKAAFSKRRKMLFNTLRTSPLISLSSERLRQAFLEGGIDPSRRAETLSVEEFRRLSLALQALLPLPGSG